MIFTMKATTIQIKNETLKRLKFFKMYSKESYDEVINKMIDEIEEGELSKFAIEGIKRGLRDVKAGRVASIEKVAKDMGIKLS